MPAHGRVDNGALAQELTAQVFSRAERLIAAHRPAGSFPSWLRTLAHDDRGPAATARAGRRPGLPVGGVPGAAVARPADAVGGGGSALTTGRRWTGHRLCARPAGLSLS